MSSVTKTAERPLYVTRTQKRLRLILKLSSHPHLESLSAMSFPAYGRNLGSPTVSMNDVSVNAAVFCVVLRTIYESVVGCTYFMHS